MVNKKQQTIKELISPVVEAMGYEFVGCEYQTHGRFSVLRVYIDKDGGVNLDNCSEVSRQLNAVLDVEDPIAGKYTLEVSSPGINRPLFEKEHFRKFIGHKASVKLYAPINERRNFIGEIVNVKDDEILLSVDGEEFSLPFANISKANLAE
jgi:ribosome maturation factor RimP